MKLFLKIIIFIVVLYILTGTVLAFFFGANSIGEWTGIIFGWAFFLPLALSWN
ncbi:MAG TPA: hypothetical protein VK675_04250 [Candidatus Paceibacterota bacterium]|nr:hypothetical protein [Candidatus Paceibacterota bacterium]